MKGGRRGGKMSAMICFILTLFILFASLPVEVNADEIKGKCLPGNRHKPEPGPEDETYKACHVFKNSSCCTSEFTNQLAVKVVQKIGNFSWTLCGNLSRRCQDFMVGVECFYSCSPYVGLWADPKVNQSFNNAPVCSGYCDDWYEACKDDMTCAKNWIWDFNYTSDGSNVCTRNCTTFKELYHNGSDLCESMWDDSFKYVDEIKNKGQCLHFKYNSLHNPNKDVVQNIFGHGKGSGGGNETNPTNGTNPTDGTNSTNPDNGVSSHWQRSLFGITLSVLFYMSFSQ